MIKTNPSTLLLNTVLQPSLTITSFLLPSVSTLLLSLAAFFREVSLFFLPFESVVELLSQNFSL